MFHYVSVFYCYVPHHLTYDTNKYANKSLLKRIEKRRRSAALKIGSNVEARAVAAYHKLLSKYETKFKYFTQRGTGIIPSTPV